MLPEASDVIGVSMMMLLLYNDSPVCRRGKRGTPVRGPSRGGIQGRWTKPPGATRLLGKSGTTGRSALGDSIRPVHVQASTPPRQQPLDLPRRTTGRPTLSPHAWTDPTILTILRTPLP